MNQHRRAPYPDAAAAWMVSTPRSRVLDLGTGRGAFAQMLIDLGHEVTCLDHDLAKVEANLIRLNATHHLVGQAESLPFVPQHFDVVTISQSLHRFAPGLALTEIARVLKPGGQLAVVYNTRDDTVPWVKRLAARMQQASPDAMTGDYGQHSLDWVADSPYFTGLERRNFRNWVPITREGMIAMARRNPAIAKLTTDVRDNLLRDVEQLYADYARPPEPLLLPFQASCWRADVDHSQLVVDEATDDDALEISVGFDPRLKTE